MISIKGESIWKDITWHYGHQDLFYLPQWQTGSKVDIFYLLYRILYCSFFVTILMTVAILEMRIPFSIQVRAGCYYTCWNFFLCMFSSIFSLMTVLKRYLEQRNDIVEVVERKSSVFLKIQWISMSIVTDSSVAVSVGYFTLVHSKGFPYVAQTAIMHLWVPILVVMDFMISSVPVSLVQCYASLGVGLLYGIFTYVYYLLGGLSVYGNHYLYKILDYKDTPGLALTALLTSLFCMVLGRGVIYLLFLLKYKLYWKYYVLTADLNEVTRYVYET